MQCAGWVLEARRGRNSLAIVQDFLAFQPCFPAPGEAEVNRCVITGQKLEPGFGIVDAPDKRIVAVVGQTAVDLVVGLVKKEIAVPVKLHARLVVHFVHTGNFPEHRIIQRVLFFEDDIKREFAFVWLCFPDCQNPVQGQFGFAARVGGQVRIVFQVQLGDQVHLVRRRNAHVDMGRADGPRIVLHGVGNGNGRNKPIGAVFFGLLAGPVQKIVRHVVVEGVGFALPDLDQAVAGRLAILPVNPTRQVQDFTRKIGRVQVGPERGTGPVKRAQNVGGGRCVTNEGRPVTVDCSEHTHADGKGARVFEKGSALHVIVRRVSDKCLFKQLMSDAYG